MSLAPLENIPQELLDGILAFIPSCYDRSRLSQTSRTIRARTLKGLFVNISMIWRAKGHSKESDPGFSPRIDLFLRTILENPQYASEICTLELLGYGYDYPSEPPSLEADSTPTANLKQLAELSIQSSGYSNCAEWLEALDQNDLDANIALLLLQCQNLTSLTLGSQLLRSKPSLPEMLAQTFLGPSPKPLSQRLRYFRLDGCGTDAGSRTTKDLRRLSRELDWRTYLAFFNCPSLREMDINLQEVMISDGLRTLTGLTTHPQNSALQSLRLHASSIAPSTLAHVLPWTPNLESLEYDYYFRHPRPQLMDDVRTALLPLRHTLQHLSFTPKVVRCGCSALQDVYIIGSCSLADFSALQTLCIPPWALLGWQNHSTRPLHQVVPRSLQYLDFVDTFIHWQVYQWRATALQEYFAQSWDGVGNASELVGISFMNDDKTVWFDEEAKGEFEGLCQRNGVTCEIYRFQD